MRQPRQFRIHAESRWSHPQREHPKAQVTTICGRTLRLHNGRVRRYRSELPADGTACVTCLNRSEES